MKPIVSNARRKKTRSREKQATRTTTPVPLLQSGPAGFSLALLLWLAVLALFGVEDFIGPIGPKEVFDILGRGAFLAVGLFCAALFLWVANPKLLRNNATVALLALVTLLSLVAARSVLYATEISGFLAPQVVLFTLPVAMAPLLATILVDGSAGLAAGFWTSFVIAVFNRGSFPLFCNGIIAAAVCAATASDVRTRAKVLKIGAAAGLATIACVFALTSLNWAITDIMNIFRQCTACVTSGVVSAIAVLLILPLFEWLFRITTNITLLELSDLGHPLLQRLAIEAPGTYHHSLVVANLAQAAAQEIAANALLARVCAYFHDIGKLIKPRFFAENIQMHPNPHDELPPSMSTLVITAHVKEGLSLAMLHDLPDLVKEVIQEHHGTSLLSYFHHKATKVKAEEGVVRSGTGNDQVRVEEGSFRYEGPRPSTRESAIIHLADSVEAASRSMERTSPGHIESLVRDIVFSRLEDGQLDESELTMNELVKIRNSFVFTLTNMLHGRVAYPKDENRGKQQSKRSKAASAASKTGAGGDHEAGRGDEGAAVERSVPDPDRRPRNNGREPGSPGTSGTD